MPNDPGDLRCRTCGRPVRALGEGRWMHRKGGHVASCDLDADHPAEPEPVNAPHGDAPRNTPVRGARDT